MNIAENLKLVRSSLNLNQSEMAEKLGLKSQQAYAYYEKRGDKISLEDAKKWGELLGIDLLFETNEYLSKKLEGVLTKNKTFIGIEDLKKIDKFLLSQALESSEKAIVNDHSEKYLSERRVKKTLFERQRIPLYDAPASAGITEQDMTPVHAPSGTIDVGDLLHDSESAIRIYGNSMIPNYPPGCVVGLVKCSSDFIEPGEVYVIETRDRRLLKRVFYKNDDTGGESITLYSDNIMKFEGGPRDGQFAYPPVELPKTEIIALYQVTGVIKRNANSVILNR